MMELSISEMMAIAAALMAIGGVSFQVRNLNKRLDDGSSKFSSQQEQIRQLERQLSDTKSKLAVVTERTGELRDLRHKVDKIYDHLIKG